MTGIIRIVSARGLRTEPLEAEGQHPESVDEQTRDDGRNAGRDVHEERHERGQLSAAVLG